MNRAGLSLVFALALGACGGSEALPGELFEGRIEAPEPLRTPLSNTPACVAGVSLYTYSKATAKGQSSHHRPEPRWAEGATLEVDGQNLAIVGEAGRPEFLEQGEQWSWDPDAPEPKVPAALLGWGIDGTLESLTNPKIHSSYAQVQATEKFSPCGEVISLRAEREGDRLRLVDPGPVESANALGFLGKLAGAFFLIFVLPIIALIAFVIRRARRRS